MDDIALLYQSSEWKTFDAERDLSTITIIPNSEEVDRIELRKRDEYAKYNLEQAKRKHANKMKTIKQKMAKVKEEQEQLQTNLVKFNAFVKEKQLKVERGSKTEQEEKELREAMTEDIEQKEATMVELTDARVSLSKQIHRFKARRLKLCMWSYFQFLFSRPFWKEWCKKERFTMISSTP